MTVITREAARAAQAVEDYLKQLKKEDYTIPPETACRKMSQLMDQSAERVYSRVQNLLETTQIFQRAMRELERARPNCGGFSRPNKILLQGLRSFEQMSVLCNWVKQNPTIQKSRTFAIAGEEDQIVPVWVKGPPRNPPSVMTIVLGHNQGGAQIRNPQYTRKKPRDPGFCCWDEQDPNNSLQKLFIDPLNSLEIHRRPSCIAAILLKANPYERGTVGHDWRYKVYEAKPRFANEASVEIPDQKSDLAGEFRAQAAGYNLAKMIATRTLKKKNLLPERHYEAYREGYNDDAEPFTSPMKIVKTFKPALKGNTGPLDFEFSKLLATRLGYSSIPVVRNCAAEPLFPE